MVRLMIDHDLNLAQFERLQKGDGVQIPKASWGMI
jgi:hypothetical protein